MSKAYSMMTNLSEKKSFVVFTNIYKWKIYKWYSPRILKKRSKSRINVLCPVYNFDVMLSVCDQIHPT